MWDMLLFPVCYMVCAFAWWWACTHRMAYTLSIWKAWCMHINYTHAPLQLNRYVHMYTVTRITTSIYHPIHPVRIHQPRPTSHNILHTHTPIRHLHSHDRTSSAEPPNPPPVHPPIHPLRSDIDDHPATQAARHPTNQLTAASHLHPFIEPLRHEPNHSHSVSRTTSLCQSTQQHIQPYSPSTNP